MMRLPNLFLGSVLIASIALLFGCNEVKNTTNSKIAPVKPDSLITRTTGLEQNLYKNKYSETH